MRQVFDLNEYRPGPVLRQIWANLHEREEAGHPMARIIRRRAAAPACCVAGPAQPAGARMQGCKTHSAHRAALWCPSSACHFGDC